MVPLATSACDPMLSPSMTTPSRAPESGAPDPSRRRGPRRRTQALLLGAIACPTESGAAVPADTTTAPAIAAELDAPTVKITGTYRYVGGEKQRQQLADAIEDVIAEMNFIARPIARKRLLESNQPSAELQLIVTADEIVVARPGRPRVSAPRDGSMIVWKSPDGDEFEVRHRLVSDVELVQEFVGDGNRSENVFKLGDDGSRVVVETTITADRLPKTLRFRMTYRRKPAKH